MSKRFQVRGINDDQSFCECCGKSGLQRVVWIEDMDTGDVKHFGTVCALKPAKGFDCCEDIKDAVKSANAKEKSVIASAGYRYRKVHFGTYTNGRDKDGSPIRTVADRALWEQCITEARAMHG